MEKKEQVNEAEKHEEGKWEYGSDDDDHKRKKAPTKQGLPVKEQRANKVVLEEEASEKGEKEVVEKVEKVVYTKDYKKDKYGNIIIDKLDDYVEPKKEIKGTRADEVKNQFDMFEGVQAESDTEETSKPAEWGVQAEDGDKDKDKKKKTKAKGKKEAAEDLDDLLKEFGVDTTKVAEKVEKVKVEKVKVEKKKVEEPKTEKTEKAEKEGTEGKEGGKEGKEGEEKKKKTVKKEKPATKPSHLSEAKREILEKQEALKKKQKKKGV